MVWHHRTDGELSAVALSTRIADILVADGASIRNRDGPYFEFRFSPLDGLTRRGIAQVIRSGTIDVRAQEHSLAVDAQANVRVLPTITLLTAATGLPAVLGLPPIGSLAGFLVSGYFLTAFYLRSIAHFKGYLDRVCARARDGIISAA